MQTTKALAMAKETTSERKTYRREDGALMVEIRPGQFINEELAALIRQSSPDASMQATPATRQRRQRMTKRQ